MTHLIVGSLAFLCCGSENVICNSSKTKVHSAVHAYMYNGCNMCENSLNMSMINMSMINMRLAKFQTYELLDRVRSRHVQITDIQLYYVYTYKYTDSGIIKGSGLKEYIQ